MSALLNEYIKCIIVELKRDENMIDLLKTTRLRKQFPNVEKIADEWAKKQKGFKQDQLQSARTFVNSRFPKLYAQSHEDFAATKRALFDALSSRFKVEK